MNVQVPSNVESVVQKLIAEGKLESEQQVVLEGLRLVLQREELEDMIQAGLEELDAGKHIEASEVHARARQLIQAKRGEA